MKRRSAILVIVLSGVVAGVILWHGGAYRAIQGTAIIGNFMDSETFIDVRTDSEWSVGHLDGALHFDVARLQQGQLPDMAKDTPIAVYCRTGHRAGQALQILQTNGFTNVRNAGGLQDLVTHGGKICAGEQSSCN
jgi:phage shock protein E